MSREVEDSDLKMTAAWSERGKTLRSHVRLNNFTGGNLVNFWKTKGHPVFNPILSGLLLPSECGLLRRVLEDYSKDSRGRPRRTRQMFGSLEVLEDVSTSTRCLQVLAMKSSGACQTRGSGTAHRRRMF